MKFVYLAKLSLGVFSVHKRFWSFEWKCMQKLSAWSTVRHAKSLLKNWKVLRIKFFFT